MPQRRHHRTGEDARDNAAQTMVPGQPIPKTERQRQDPLAHRDIGQHPIDQVRRPFGHAPTAAPRAEAAPFAGERHEPILATARTSEPSEPTSEDTAPDVGAELPFDEGWQPLPIPPAGRVNTERLEVVAHDAVQDVPLGTTMPIGF